MTPNEVKHARRMLGITQAELGRAIGVNRSTVNRWEAGIHPVPEMAEKLIKMILKEEAIK